MKTAKDIQDFIGYCTDGGCRRVALVGHPGSGKTMVARRIRGALPPFELGTQEGVQAFHIRKLAGFDEERRLDTARPFRAPHHTCSTAAIIGASVEAAPALSGLVRPGELSLSHGGVLFLDEVTEFRLETLRALGAALDRGHCEIHRAGVTKRFPAVPRVLVAALSPCPCGYAGSERRRCCCKPETVLRYWMRATERLSALGIETVRELSVPREELQTVGQLPT